jgi:hypothetical protein
MLLVVLGNRLFGSLPFTPLSTTLRPRPPLVNNFGSPITKIRVGCTGTGDVCGPTELEKTIHQCARHRLGSNGTANPWVGSGWNHVMEVRALTRWLCSDLGADLERWDPPVPRSATKCHDGNASTRAATIVGPSMTPPSDVPTRSTTPATASARPSRADVRSASGRSRTPSNSVASHSRTQAL